MKKIAFVVVALMLTSGGGWAAAAMHFKSKAQKPISTMQANREGVLTTRSKRSYAGVKCRNGSWSYSRQNVCVRRGGPLEPRIADLKIASAK